MSVIPDELWLYEIAEAQAGYFTTKQARAAGYSRQLLSHHTQAGNIKRVRHGIYRLTRFPHSPREELYIAWLRCGPNAVISHDSALDLYDLSDAMPTEVHITVPRGSSLRRPGIRLHTGGLLPDEVTHWQGLPVTTVERTIADIAARGVQEWIVRQAIQEAMARGRMLPDSLLVQAQRHPRPVRDLLTKLVKQAQRA
ncbi:MAG: type IV toxin-antitoxin system AbiEi family antitoxin domain-containing protein [Chloroflexi bacterium]|nr:type IV toxin-antitoxin system AbiEi family antitoxin domain-containing protein [Chloroflexota bacterium]MCL5276111.1 type IV toxin-antitoxin system AbiEi family antitoxin domain-containing protein [Chloroflexota bacterium]